MGQYKCDQCNNGYTRIPNLNIHKKRVHDNISYSCDECNYNTNQKSNLKSHTELKHGSKNLRDTF